MNLDVSEFNTILGMAYYIKNKVMIDKVDLIYKEGDGIIEFILLDTGEMEIKFRDFKKIDLAPMEFNFDKIESNEGKIENVRERMEITGVDIEEYLDYAKEYVEDIVVNTDTGSKWDEPWRVNDKRRSLPAYEENIETFKKNIKRMIFKVNVVGEDDMKEMRIEHMPMINDELSYIVDSEGECNIWASVDIADFYGERLKPADESKANMEKLMINKALIWPKYGPVQKSVAKNDEATKDGNGDQANDNGNIGKSDGISITDEDIREMVDKMFEENKYDSLNDTLGMLRKGGYIKFREDEKGNSCVKFGVGFYKMLNDKIKCEGGLCEYLLKGVKEEYREKFKCKKLKAYLEEKELLDKVNSQIKEKFIEEVQGSKIGGELFGEDLVYTPEEEEKNKNRGYKDLFKEYAAKDAKLAGDPRLKRIAYDSIFKENSIALDKIMDGEGDNKVFNTEKIIKELQEKAFEILREKLNRKEVKLFKVLEEGKYKSELLMHIHVDIDKISF